MFECKYCKMLKNGDIPEDRINITEGIVSIGNIETTLLASVEKGQLLVGWYGEEVIAEFSEKINFCPMCGRRLSKENEIPVTEDGQKK